jgi:hypothetical protein
MGALYGAVAKMICQHSYRALRLRVHVSLLRRAHASAKRVSFCELQQVRGVTIPVRELAIEVVDERG